MPCSEVSEHSYTRCSHKFTSFPLQMSSSTSVLLFLTITCRLLHVNPNPCPPQKFTCGKTTLDIEFPFFTPKSPNQCSGFHYIQCLNLVPTVHFNGSSYFYPVTDISYHDRAIIIHDLNLSAYFRGSDCVFLYDFISPVPGFPFSSGESFFDCRQEYDFSEDSDLSLCQDYSLYYSSDYGKRDLAALPGYCSDSSDLWFHRKLSFAGGRNGGETSLLAAGFSPEWVNRQDCFSCEFAASGNCSGVAGDKSCRCSSSCQGKKKKKKTNMGVIIIGASAAAAGVLLVSILCFIYYWRHFSGGENQQRSPSSIFLSYYASITGAVFSDKAPDLAGCPYQSIHIFSCEELYKATNCFDAAMEIGGGGFGIVYKGTLSDGRPVAVKRMYEKTYRRAEQFINEVVILSRLHHENLVSLYGCTSPRSRELLLVYELVPNGTVADHLHGTRAAEGRLTWPRRLSVAVETAAALSYLHAVDPPIVHRDIKTGNILLDAEFHVKVADFGLSRLFPGDGATHISSAPQGTPGYLDPEYHRSYQLTDRSDVYSFGVVLAELLSSKPAVDLSRERAEISLSALAVSKIQSGKLDELVDGKMVYDSGAETRRTVTLVAELAFRCLQADREMRPAIKEVLEVLNGLQSGVFWGHSAEQVVGSAEVEKGGDARPISPDSVTERWVSRSATPTSSVDQQ